MSTKPRQKPTARRPNGTVKNLAAALGITTRHTSSLLAAGMPAEPAAAAAWRAAQSGTAGTSDSAELLRRERVLLVRQQREREELENARRRGEMMPKSEHVEIAIRCAVAARTAFWGLLGILPPILAGLSEIPIVQILEKHFRECLDRLHQGDPELWDSSVGHEIIELMESKIRPPRELEN